MTLKELAGSFTTDVQFVLYKDGDVVSVADPIDLPDNPFYNSEISNFKAYCFKVTVRAELK